MHAYRHTTYIQTDNIHTYIHTHTHTHTYIHTYTYIQTDKQTDRQTNRHTDRHTYIHTYIPTYIHLQTLYELLTATVSYLRSLDVLTSVFLESMNLQSASAFKHLINKKQKEELFINIQEIKDNNVRYTTTVKQIFTATYYLLYCNGMCK